MKLSRRAEKVEPFHAMAFGQRAGELRAAGHDVVALSLGEPDFGAPAAVRQAMRDAMDGRPLPYTPAMGSPALRRAIAGFYRDRHGVEVDPGRILITAGASAALLVVLAATTGEGDEVVLADPSYPCNRQLVETFGGKVVSVPSTPETKFQLDVSSVAKTVTDRATAVMIASPSNPTGTSIPFDELTAICAFAREKGLWRIVDEIYLDLSDHVGGIPPRSVLTVDPDAIVINSFSKFFGMTGWRLGWAVLPEALVPSVERLATNYFLCASAPAQHAALACFTPETLREAEDRRIELSHRRELALVGLAEIGLDVPVTPDGAFYIYFDVTRTGLTSWEFCERALEGAFVALTPGRDFGAATADTHVRLSYAASRESLKEGLSRLAEFVARLREGGPSEP